MQFFIYFLFSYQSTLADKDLKSETWFISQSLDKNLEDIKKEDLVYALKHLGISAKIKPAQDILNPYLILKGKYFAVYLAPTFYHPDQVWILANPDFSTAFEKLNLEQLQEMENFRYLIGEIFLKYLNYQGYVMFVDFKRDYGFGHPTLCLEMVPATLKGPQQNELNLREKIERGMFVLLNENDSKQLSPQAAKAKVNQLKIILAKARKESHSIENQKRRTENTLPWIRKVTHLSQLKALCLQELRRELLHHHGLLVEQGNYHCRNKNEIPNINSDGGEFTETQVKESKITKCVFCDPKVLESQFVYKYGDFACLYNFRPYTVGYHFMIVPYLPLHIENWQNFSLSDVLKIDQFAQAIVKALKQESGRDDIILFVQNGLAAGMTVPHCHMHILLRPTKLHLLAQVLTEIGERKRNGLTVQEMAPVKEKFKQRLQQLLLATESQHSTDITR